MTALQIIDIGPTLNRMLKGDMFDHFLLKEASISAAFTTTIDGVISDSFFSAEEKEKLELLGLSYIPFSFVRPICLDLMKGSRKPTAFRFQFLLSPQSQAKTVKQSGSSFQPTDISGLFLTLTYKNDTLVCTTGISYKVFSADKSLENEWDRLAAVFFKQNGIAVSKL